MKSAPSKTVETLKTHHIDEAFVESNGREVVDIICATDGKVIGRVTLGDEEAAIAAAERIQVFRLWPPTRQVLDRGIS